MSGFTVFIDEVDGYATATHRASGHVFEFSIKTEAPHCRDGRVQENPQAEYGPDSLWEAALAAVIAEARASGLIPR
jgi:hypothetical protein